MKEKKKTRRRRKKVGEDKLENEEIEK